MLSSIGQSSGAHPLPVVMRFYTSSQTLLVAGPIAVDGVPKLIPIDLAVIVVLTFFVPFQIRVGQGHAEDFGLRYGRVNKLLAQVVVADALDTPAHGLLTVRAIRVGRPEHGEALPPEPIDGILHHRLLFGGALHHHQQSLIALALVERLFFTDITDCP